MNQKSLKDIIDNQISSCDRYCFATCDWIKHVPNKDLNNKY